MKNPYGLSDFYRIRTENQRYIDRTEMLPVVEQSGEQLLFLRPRRFGKSLWLSVLENYYDLNRADDFAMLFGDLAVGKNPTANHNRYLILKWNFSVIDTNGSYEQITRALHDHINSAIYRCSVRYRSTLKGEVEINNENALFSLDRLLIVASESGHPLYLLIDEYDNFANEVLTSRDQGKPRYDELVRGEGILKTVFKAIKAAAEGQGLERVFITGVSPVVMSDITSGYNVVKNISQWAEFSRLCGFVHEEVVAINHQIASGCQLDEHHANEAMTMMRSFYNGYRFCVDDGVNLYNPTLCLYFWDEWQRRCKYPQQMLDANLAMDKNRIRYIAALPHGTEVIEQALNSATPLSVAALANEFGVEAMLNDPPDASFIISLLIYFGVLTIEEVTPLGKISVTLPNQVVRSLYVERIR